MIGNAKYFLVSYTAYWPHLLFPSSWLISSRSVSASGSISYIQALQATTRSVFNVLSFPFSLVEFFKKRRYRLVSRPYQGAVGNNTFRG
jgi:hypothetical protein